MQPFKYTLTKQCRELVDAIEELPASDQQTKVSQMACKLNEDIFDLLEKVNRLIEVRMFENKK